MTDFFTTLYSKISNQNLWLERTRINTILRIIVRLASNITLPIYFWLTRKNAKYRLLNRSEQTPLYIVSLTSYPARIKHVWLVIESLLHQTHKPDRIILWLAKEQFTSIDKIPQNLQKLCARGLQIEVVDGDLKPHKKYFYAMQSFPNSFIITVDDDVFYPTYTIEKLIQLNEKHPKSICCHLSHFMTWDHHLLRPYKEWEPNLNQDNQDLFTIIPLGVGGILYPPYCLHEMVFNDKIIQDCCLRADDLWLKCNSLLHHTPCVQTSSHFFPLPIYNLGSATLAKTNIAYENDKQIALIRQVCVSHHQIDPFDFQYIASLSI